MRQHLARRPMCTGQHGLPTPVNCSTGSPAKRLRMRVHGMWARGSGQAAMALTQHFAKVYATDIDEAQIAAAEAHPKISYSQAEAHASNLQASSVDCITVATALHWFDHARFWQEVRRVARPGALFCGWTYDLGVADEDVQNLLLGPVQDIVDPYWADGNRLSWRGYAADELGMPFEVIKAPDFACNLSWTAEQIGAFARSWSAHKKARLDGHGDALALIESQAVAKLGQKQRNYTLPLHVLAARVI